MKTLILGLGNPILSDDGVGFRVAGELRGRLDQQEVTVMETSMAGLSSIDIPAHYPLFPPAWRERRTFIGLVPFVAENK